MIKYRVVPTNKCSKAYYWFPVLDARYWSYKSPKTDLSEWIGTNGQPGKRK